MANNLVRIRAGKFTKLKVSSLSRAVKLQLEASFKNSVRTFVETLASRVHVQTGESFASLEPLAAEVGVTLFPSAGGSGFRRKNELDRRGKDIKGTKPRGQLSGAAKGAKAFRLGFDGTSFFFKFRLPTFQLQLHTRGTRGSGSMQGALGDAELATAISLELDLKPKIDSLVNEWARTGKVRSRFL